MVLLELAQLTAASESYAAGGVEDLVKGGYLPEGFGSHPDGSQFSDSGEYKRCSIRGRRGFFTPIADMEVGRVTAVEQQWFAERADFFSGNIRSLDPMVAAVKRYEQEDKIERVVFDARILPFGEDKYNWLLSRLGDPLDNEVAAVEKRLKEALQQWMKETNDWAADPAKLNMLTAENDAVVAAKKGKYPKTGWQYLEYLKPESAE